jgi:hypothetical protein
LGVAHTSGTNVGCIDAFDEVAGEPDDLAPEKAVSFALEQASRSFDAYRSAFAFIDQTYATVVAPMMDQICGRLRSPG